MLCWFLTDESSSWHFCRGSFLLVTFSLFLIITLKVFLTCSTSLMKIKALGWQVKTSGTLLIKAFTSRRKILMWRNAHGGHDSCFRAASANFLMDLRVRKSTKLEFRFLLWSHSTLSTRMSTEFLFQLGELSKRLPFTSSTVIWVLNRVRFAQLLKD